MRTNNFPGLNIESNKILTNLTDRVAIIEKKYNPERLNLHFEGPPQMDLSIFEELLPIGQEAWNIIQHHLSWQSSYWFYDYFLLIANASFTAEKIKNDSPISNKVLNELVVLLVDIRQKIMKAEIIGDITKRNYEAIFHFVLAFDVDGELNKLANINVRK